MLEVEVAANVVYSWAAQQISRGASRKNARVIRSSNTNGHNKGTHLHWRVPPRWPRPSAAPAGLC